MASESDKVRVIIAVTEASPVQELWRAALEACEGTTAEVVAVFVDDERWQRAASLPFTREISKLGGGPVEFTTRHASRLFAETVATVKRELDALAAQSGRAITFETLAGSDPAQTKHLVGSDMRHLLFAPPALMRFPLYAELTRLEIDIRIIETARSD